MGTSTTANFKLPGSVNLASVVQRPTPGPSDYNLGNALKRGVERAPGTGACIHPKKANAPALNIDVPGPGDYQVSDPSISVEEPSPTSARKPRPKPKSPRMPSHARVIQKGLDMLAGGKHDAHEGDPGPGSYNPVVPDSSVSGTQGTSSFQQGNSHHPRTWRPDAPGPFEYQKQESLLEKAPSGTNFHANRTKRFQKPKDWPPGPAYYSPKPPEAKSFLLNIQKNWSR